MKNFCLFLYVCTVIFSGCTSEKKSITATTATRKITQLKPTSKKMVVLSQQDSAEVFNFLKNSDSVRKHVEAILKAHQQENGAISSPTNVGNKKVLITVFFDISKEKNLEIKRIFESGAVAFTSKGQSFNGAEYLIFVFFEHLPDSQLLHSALMQELFHVQTYEARDPERQEYLSELVSMYSDHYQSYIVHRLANFFSGKLEGEHYRLVKEGYKNALQKCNLVVLGNRLEITETDCECIRKNY